MIQFERTQGFKTHENYEANPTLPFVFNKAFSQKAKFQPADAAPSSPVNQ